MSLAESAPLPSGSSLAPPFEPAATASPSSAKDAQDAQDAQDAHLDSGAGEVGKKQKLRGLFGLGKKKGAHVPGEAASSRAGTDAPSAASASASAPASASASGSSAKATLLKPAPTLLPKMATSTASASEAAPKPTGAAGSAYGGYPVLPPSSPGRSMTALSSSPRISSPAGSQIFERDVQESSSVPMPNSPAIPSHITTENHIPPVLDASSEAITDGHLDPDTVEIITHAHHLTVAGGSAGAGTGAGISSSGASGTGAWVEDLASSFVTDKTADRDRDDSASNHGPYDATDVRRLSFISFADVVQAEQQHQHQHQQQQQQQQTARSPTTTDWLGTSPPTSNSGSIKGLELSPPRKAIGSPTRSPKLVARGSVNALVTGVTGSDISVETMSQALRRTASGDFSGVRSTPQSPI